MQPYLCRKVEGGCERLMEVRPGRVALYPRYYFHLPMSTRLRRIWARE